MKDTRHNKKNELGNIENSFGHVEFYQSQDVRPHDSNAESLSDGQLGPSAPPSLVDASKRVWTSNALIRLTLKCTLVAFCLCCLVAPFLPRTKDEQILIPPNVYTYYEPLALYDDAIAMAETFATAPYPFIRKQDINFFYRLRVDANSLCLALYPRGDTWTPDRGSMATSNFSSIWQQIFSDNTLADDEDFNEEGDIDLYGFCNHIHRTISAAESVFRDDIHITLLVWENDSIMFLWRLLRALTDGIAERDADARAWPQAWSVKIKRYSASLLGVGLSNHTEPSLVWPADGDQVEAVKAVHRLLTSHVNFATNKYGTKDRASILSLKTKLRAADKLLEKLTYIAYDVVIRFFADAPLSSARDWLLLWGSRDSSSDDDAAAIKRISQAVLHLRGARANITSLITDLDSLITLADSIRGCETAWVRLAEELISMSTPAQRVTNANSSYVWTGNGWMIRRSRAERRRANASKSINACADLKERLRNIPGRQESHDDPTVDEDDYDNTTTYDQEPADAVILFMPDPARVLPLVHQSWENCSLLYKVRVW